jgi:hypothetical protein
MIDDVMWPCMCMCARFAGYFWLRFGHGSSDYISPLSGMQAPVHVQMSFMKSLAKGVRTSKYGWVLDVLEQLTICK